MEFEHSSCRGALDMVSSTNKTDHHDITEMSLKVALNPIDLTLTICL